MPPAMPLAPPAAPAAPIAAAFMPPADPPVLGPAGAWPAEGL